MDFSNPDLNFQFNGLLTINFNSGETIPGFRGQCSVHRQLLVVFEDNVGIVPASRMQS